MKGRGRRQREGEKDNKERDSKNTMKGREIRQSQGEKEVGERKRKR